MRVVYSPKHTGTFSSEDFTVSTAGGNRLPLNLRGSAAGPQVTLSASSFNFGNVPAGQAPSRVLYMQVRQGSTKWDGWHISGILVDILVEVRCT